MPESSLRDAFVTTLVVAAGGVFGAYARLTFVPANDRPSPLEIANSVIVSAGAAIFGAELFASGLGYILPFVDGDDPKLVGFTAWGTGVIAVNLVRFLHGLDLKSLFKNAQKK